MYITVIFVLFALLSIFLIAKNSQLSKATKSVVITIFIIVIALAVIYEWIVENAQKEIKPLVLEFKSGNILICNGKKIDKQNYIYESGTSSLIPKNGIIGDTYSIKECYIPK